MGADWGLVDPKTNIFSADTRYNFRTDDGADIFIQTAGPKAPDGHLHLRLVFETGSPKYYWLNNVVGKCSHRMFSRIRMVPRFFSDMIYQNPAIGVLTSGLPSNGNLKVLQIDAWNVSPPEVSIYLLPITLASMLILTLRSLLPTGAQPSLSTPRLPENTQIFSACKPSN